MIEKLKYVENTHGYMFCFYLSEAYLHYDEGAIVIAKKLDGEIIYFEEFKHAYNYLYRKQKLNRIFNG
jgi:hypothetical protein